MSSNNASGSTAEENSKVIDITVKENGDFLLWFDEGTRGFTQLVHLTENEARTLLDKLLIETR